jgi:small subunit ribosomal protein S6
LKKEVNLQKYETIFIIDSLLKSEEIDSIIGKYERFISANGGQIETIERWGKKRLAYEIKKRQYGYYVLIRFDGPPTMIKPLEREYRLNESILRFKTLTIPKRAAQVALTKTATVNSQKAKVASADEVTDEEPTTAPADEDDKVTEYQTETEASEAEKDMAEAEKDMAEAEKDVAEAEKDVAEAEKDVAEEATTAAAQENSDKRE